MRRLEGLKKLSGLSSWRELAGLLGVTDRGVLLWRRGERRPSMSSFQAIMALARDVPGGDDLMTGGAAEAGAGEQAGKDEDTEGTSYD